jgi:oligosaccharide repeat unit polymerase
MKIIKTFGYLVSPKWSVAIFISCFIIFCVISKDYYETNLLSGYAILNRGNFQIAYIALAIFVYCGGIKLGEIGKKNFSFSPILTINDCDRLRKISIIISTLYTASTLYLVINIFGIQGVIQNITLLRDDYKNLGGFAANLLLPLQKFLLLWAATLWTKDWRRLEVAALLLLTIVSALIFQARILIFDACIIMLLQYFQKNKPGSKIVFYSFAALTFVSLMTMLRVSYIDKSSTQILVDEFLKYAMSPFSYTSAIIDNNIYDFYSGFYRLGGFLFLSIGKFFGFSYELSHSYIDYIGVYYSESLNQPGLIGELYFGFGPIFLFPVVFILGLVFGRLYQGFVGGGASYTILYPIYFVLSVDFIRQESVLYGLFPTILVVLYMYRFAKFLVK